MAATGPDQGKQKLASGSAGPDPAVQGWPEAAWGPVWEFRV